MSRLLERSIDLIALFALLTFTYKVRDTSPVLAGVVVTAAHVLVLRMDQANGQPRWIALAARADAVQVEAPTPVFSQPTIIVRSGSQWWSIQGSSRVMRPEPVVTAWKRAVAN